MRAPRRLGPGEDKSPPKDRRTFGQNETLHSLWTKEPRCLRQKALWTLRPRGRLAQLPTVAEMLCDGSHQCIELPVRNEPGSSSMRHRGSRNRSGPRAKSRQGRRATPRRQNERVAGSVPTCQFRSGSSRQDPKKNSRGASHGRGPCPRGVLSLTEPRSPRVGITKSTRLSGRTYNNRGASLCVCTMACWGHMPSWSR
jgi:hypothetical protein